MAEDDKKPEEQIPQKYRQVRDPAFDHPVTPENRKRTWPKQDIATGTYDDPLEW